MKSDASAGETLGDTLVPVINRLQDIFSQVKLDFNLELPQVAVIGSQSAGKSSVLEALVGRDLLPRGPHICTRRPLLLQLVKSSASTRPQAEQEWAEFLHSPGKRYYDDERIREEIQAETDRLTGQNKAVSDEPIRLRITSPNVLTMTLVDLPGLAKNPIGDQPSDIEQRIRALVHTYIKAPTCLVLAVSAANVDLANSDALEMARSVDPEGERTIGVLTKLDIMDNGTDASAVLRNEVVPLRLGYLGVVNRSQHDLNTKRSMAETRAAEAAFFASHPAYAKLPGQCGIPALARVLNARLVGHIRTLLPSLRVHLEESRESRAQELAALGSAPPGHSSAERGALLLKLLDSYATHFGEMLDGRSQLLPVSELAGGARIRHIFQDIFCKGLEELHPSSELTDQDIRTAIKNSGGVKGSLLIPEAPFELLVRRAIQRLLPPALQCKEFVHGELLQIAGQCLVEDVARFPALQQSLLSAMEAFINTGAAPAERMIRDCVACELAYINTDHVAFIGGNRAIAKVMENRCSSRSSSESESDGVGDADGMQTDGRSERQRPLLGGVLPAPTADSSQGRSPASYALQPTVMITTARSGYEAPQPELSRVAGRLPGRVAALGLSSGLGQGQNPGPSMTSKPAPESKTAAVGVSNHQESWSAVFGGNHGGSTVVGGANSQASRSNDSVLDHPPRTLRVGGVVSSQEEVAVQVTRVLVESYFDIVRGNLQDSVPKAIMHFLVNATTRGLQQHLISTLYTEARFEELMRESDDIADKRQRCTAALSALQEALTTLERLPANLMSQVSSSVNVVPGGIDGAAWAQPKRQTQDFCVRSSSGAGARLARSAVSAKSAPEETDVVVIG